MLFHCVAPTHFASCIRAHYRTPDVNNTVQRSSLEAERSDCSSPCSHRKQPTGFRSEATRINVLSACHCVRLQETHRQIEVPYHARTGVAVARILYLVVHSPFLLLEAANSLMITVNTVNTVTGYAFPHFRAFTDQPSLCLYGKPTTLTIFAFLFPNTLSAMLALWLALPASSFPASPHHVTARGSQRELSSSRPATRALSTSSPRRPPA